MNKVAACSCGTLSVTVTGELVKISACHCISCQKRTGSAFSVAVFYPTAQASVNGKSEIYARPGDSGHAVEFHFCRICATTLFWYPAFRPGWVGVAIGCFEDRTLAPTQAVYEHERRAWVTIALPAG